MENKKLEDIKKLVKILHCADYKDLFMALCLKEKIDYMHDIEDITKQDIDFLDNLYNDFIENDSITSFINSEILEKLEIEEMKDYNNHLNKEVIK